MTTNPTCPSCSTVISNNAKFCPECGTAMPQETRVPVAQPTEVDLGQRMATLAAEVRRYTQLGWKVREQLDTRAELTGRGNRRRYLEASADGSFIDRLFDGDLEVSMVQSASGKSRIRPWAWIGGSAATVILVLIVVGSVSPSSNTSNSSSQTTSTDKAWSDSAYLVRHAATKYVDAVKVQSQSDTTDALKNFRDYCGAASGLSAPTSSDAQTSATYVRSTCSTAGFPIQ